MGEHEMGGWTGERGNDFDVSDLDGEMDGWVLL